MAECIIARGGGSSNRQDIPIYSDRCSVVVTVKDLDNTPITDLSVHCNDGGTWYNYHTNENGQCLFTTNSGTAVVTAQNFSINGNYKWIDMTPTTSNIDAPVGTAKNFTMTMSWYNNFHATVMTSNIYNKQCYENNYKFRHYTHANAFIGGGGGHSGGNERYPGGGGGAGGVYIANNISINLNQNYKFYCAKGGNWYTRNSTGSLTWQGESGGSSTAFGFTATGGAGGTNAGVGGEGGTGTNTGARGGNNNKAGVNSSFSNFGGGGAGTLYSYNTSHTSLDGGTPFGGDSGVSVWGSNGRLTGNGMGYNASGPGGGGGAWPYQVDNYSSSAGGKGGTGMLDFHFY